MSEVPGSSEIKETLEKVVSLAAQEDNISWGFKGELARLGHLLAMIQAVLTDAEQRQVREEAVRLWLKMLKDITFDGDDMLDELTYEILRRKVELQNRMTKKVRNFFSLSNPIVFRFKMAHKVKKINTSLDKIKNDAIALGLSKGSVDTTAQFSQNRVTDPFVDDSRVVGRENDASEIVKKIIDSGNQEVISVIPIVGMAGLGKTTFAQLVYNSDEIKRYFDARIWICVSENFDARRILSEFLESLNPAKARMENINTILENLQKELGGKRYLLILDDVWNEDHVKWDSLKSHLILNTTKGNNIIVTTRSNRVASIMKTLPTYHLGKLSEDDCWTVFKDRAFANGGVSMTPDLEQIGKEIAKKCAGVPLAVKVLGGMMCFKAEKDDWLSIQNSKIWDLPEDENEISPAILKLSFDHLPSLSLRQCFAYCSMIPKDFVIEKDNLIQLWMAQGLLKCSQGSNLEMEDLGNEYFNILLANSLFQDAIQDEYDNIICCKMHDLVHDLAQYVSRVEIQHLSSIPTGEISPTSPKESAGKVRTLSSMGNDLGKMLSNFKVLRVLNLHGADIEELPISIGMLKQLRYLDVSQTRIKVFPKSIAKLYNLQTLRLMNCNDLEEFPKELKSLISLRHFCIDDDYRNMEMPNEMGRLTCLQTLPYFVVGQEQGRGIEELGCLMKLRGKLLIDNLEHVRDGEEAKKANLQGKTDIYKLGFIWSQGREGDNNDEAVLEGLQPRPNLKSLTIENFMGDKFPSWMMTTSGNGLVLDGNLVEIKLINCKRCEQIPMLGQLPFLRVLEIRGMGNVKSIFDVEAGALFPALKRLTLSSMGNLEDWMTPAGGEVFPCLEELYLDYCPKLKIPPSHFSSLRELNIRHIDRSTLENISNNLTTLTSLSIRGVSVLSFLLEGLLQNNKNLVSLEICNCRTLTYIPPLVSGCCTYLRSLVIGWCEKLSYSPDGLHTLASLEELKIFGCPNLESIPSIHGLTSLRTLEIEICGGLTSLPSGLQSCTSLEVLTVIFCPNLISFTEDLRELGSLSTLRILYCGKLKCLPEGLHYLTCFKTLEIGGFSKKLRSLPDQVQHLTALTSLYIKDFDGVDTLPEWLGNLSSLEHLSIERCENLVYLPSVEAMRRLTKLQELTISNCPLLEKAMERGSEWSKISPIPQFNYKYSTC